MKKIKRFGRISNMRIEEVFAFHTMVEKLLAEHNPKGAEAVNAKYKLALHELGDAIKVKRKSSYTVDMRNIDKRLASVLRSVRAYAKVMLSFPEEEKRQIAQFVHAAIDECKVLSNCSYEDRYGSIEQVLDAFDMIGDEKLTFFGIHPWVEEVRRGKDQFVSARMARVEEKSGRVVGLTGLRREKMDALFEEMVNLVNALCLVDDPEVYSSFIDSLNELIDEQLEKLSSRHKRADGKEGTGQ